MAPTLTSRSAAKTLVEQIAENHGSLSADILAKIPESVRRHVIQRMRNKDKIISSTITTLAKSLYTSKARFVFELLQNAEDNHYNYCKAVPFVQFSIYRDRIVVDCNEDGFEPENLKAICNIGKSSKQGTQGYIGQKGIGFKSVFMVASKVEIQSGNFSFYFEHRPGDPGLGMISPEWQETTDELPHETTTRITLHLHDSDADGPPDIILQQFENLQETMLLFFKNIRRVVVSLYDAANELERETTYSISTTPDQRSRLTKKITRNRVDDEPKTKDYHVTRHTATNLAQNENRDYSETEQAERAYSKSEVVLAFPLSPDADPFLEKQHIYAFLPVRKEGFDFLIQADWVTQANREGIVVSSQRNIDLTRGVAEAFAKAAGEFCQHEKLRYTWMRFLPQLIDERWEGFWKELVEKIISMIGKVPVMVPFDNGPLRLITDSKRFLPADLDQNDDPLLEDISPKIYLSEKYKGSDLGQLTQCDLDYINMDMRLARLRADLARSDSKVKSSTTNKNWHNSLARALLICWNEGLIELQKEVKQLELLPIGGEWLSANTTVSRLHFPTSNGIEIPNNLGLHLLDADAIESKDRKKFFVSLGATEATEQEIKSLIRQKHTPPVFLNISQIKSHVEFLYLTHTKEMKSASYSYVYLHLAPGNYISRPQSVDVHFLDSQPYGPKELLGFDTKYDEDKILALFLHDRLANSSLCGSARGHSLSWIEFLHSCIGVRHRLRLTNGSSSGTAVSLTLACEYIRRNNAEKFVGLLQYCWIDEKDAIMGSEGILKTLRETKVNCLNGGATELYNTILPLPKLQKLCAQYTDVGGVPFLAIDGPLKDSQLSKWVFLNRNFGVTIDENFHFYLEVLKAMACSESSSEKVYDLFEMIYTQWKQSTDKGGDKKRLRELLNDYGLALPAPVGNYIYDEVVAFATPKVSWRVPLATTWDGPQEMMCNAPIKARFESDIVKMNPVLEAFYRDLAGVRDYTLDDLIEELRTFRDYWSKDLEHDQEKICNITRKIYTYLPHFMEEEDKEGLRQTFDLEALIWKLVDGKTQWYKLSDCIWSGSTEIPGKAMLSDQWGDMENIFVELLKVPKLSFNMVYEKLKSIGTSSETRVSEAKETLEALNSFLAVGDARHSNPKDALKACVFPVRQPEGNVELVTAAVQFAIPDRQHWAKAFRDKVRMLDFSLNEIQRLKPLLRWTALESRYLSATVKEGSDIDRLGCVSLHDSRKDIPPKAHALYRIAKHFESPRVRPGNRNLYDTFKNTSLWTTDRIFTTLELSQDGETHQFKAPGQDCGKVHIEDDLETSLKIYVPRDPMAQEISYLSAVQRRLLGWIMTPPCSSTPSKSLDPAALSILKSVLSAHRLTLASLLEEEGIGTVDFKDDFEEDVDAGNNFPARNSRPSTPATHLLSGSPAIPEFSDESGSEYLVQDTPGSSVPSLGSFEEVRSRQHNEFSLSSGSSSSPGKPFSIPIRGHLGAHPQQLDPVEADVSDSIDVSDAEYVRILNMAISKARTATLPAPNSPNFTTLDVSSRVDTGRIKYRNPFELTCKIGAAGELFAYLFLSRFLLGFEMENWASTMRGYVSAHPDYTELKPWPGTETSDITYEDTQGILIKKLIESGYFDSTWSNVRANFFIEVKTTTGPCQKRFIMSQHQYRMMQDYSNADPSASRKNIYVVFRVFDLGKDTMDFRIFVDPEKHQQEATLKFSSQWAVVPVR